MKRNTVYEIMQLPYPDSVICLSCGKEMHPNKYGLCENCNVKLNSNFCLRCGRHKVGSGDYCDECISVSTYVDEARSSVIYDGIAKDFVHRLKFGFAKYLVPYMVEYMVDTLNSTAWKVDCVTFVPMHAKAQKKRGYNQARLLAELIAERYDTKCLQLIVKNKETPNQARLKKSDRIENLKNAYESVEKAPDKILLVDDVMTTGATLNECAKILKRNGTKIVYALTFASVPERPLLDKKSRDIKDFRR